MNIHFIGIGGIGMSALAQLHAMGGDKVTGSDRLINKGLVDLPVFNSLRALGVNILAQNGSGITKETELVVVTTAIEEDNVELVKAKSLGINIMHRAALLATHVAQNRTIAISGTSGKSTTTAILYDILVEADLSPSVITGATLLALQEKGFYGNVYRGAGDILIIEADESDGSLVNYSPEIGVCLNIQKDHKELDILKGFFNTFSSQCKQFLYNADEEGLKEQFKGFKTFGLEEGDTRAENILMDGFGSTFFIDGVKMHINTPGEHNIKNAVAAIAVAKELGVPLNVIAAALEKFKGVYRRFNSVGVFNKIEVIDDFAHNPHKIKAAVKATQLRGKRVLAYFQPHSFASIQLLTSEFIENICATLRPQDKLWMTEAYYPGGTIPQNVTAETIVKGLLKSGCANVKFNSCREEIAKEIAAEAKEGDIIIVMGARDPSLTGFAKSILKAVETSYKKSACPECMIGNCCLKNHKTVKI
ncbi:Putative UDP-N-acetylmuramate-alanine ligase [Elusimicrobium minutum Pei191]|uniref:Putative UDP-N-acetylmuramate-alanine ligase n=1 Tax=Elusimicrobium minutum (strain Pei191) TaxID=445932 RepID=B2KAQ9_ELUMP|nr:Mur ligase domain-containing protein [Elusimicrobium minutum]ACC97605.1 Putative UDP-N-acetylmuramate-alanine ligase [Elusimicrobium minutum Pei191]